MALNNVPLSEPEYKEWYAKYLGDVESLNGSQHTSPLLNIPKLFNRKKWVVIHVVLLLVGIAASFTFALINSSCSHWTYEWFSNAFLNMSFGLVVSLLIFIFTNHKERNIAFYGDVIPMLKLRYANMKEAYYDYCLKIGRYHQQKRYDICYQAWQASSATCYAIIDFFKFLLTVMPYKPKCINFDIAYLEKEQDKIYNMHIKVEEEYIKQKAFSNKLAQECQMTIGIGGHLLYVLNSLIQEFQQTL